MTDAQLADKGINRCKEISNPRSNVRQLAEHNSRCPNANRREELRQLLVIIYRATRSETQLAVASSGWPFVTVVPGQMTHLVASLTLDSAWSYVMQGTFLTQGKASSIPTVFSWGGSISPDSFLPSIMLLLVIIVAVVIVVAVILVVVVGEGSSIIKLSFVIIAVTFPSILLGNPPMKTSMSFLEFGTIVGHKTANSWNLLMIFSWSGVPIGIVSICHGSSSLWLLGAEHTISTSFPDGALSWLVLQMLMSSWEPFYQHLQDDTK
ncbi:hypothetical protein Tco_1337318 [Tanacetum coccineum]